MRRFLVIMAALISVLSAQEKMSVEDAIRIGLENNYSIQIARNNAETAENNTGKGTANFLPTLDASGNLTYSTTDQETNSPFSFGDSDTEQWGGSVSLNWTLFDGMRMFVDNNRYHTLARLGEYQSRAIIENNVVAIMRAYYNLVQQELLLDVIDTSLSISETRVRQEEVRHEIGGASSSQFLNAQVAYNNDKSDYLNQQLQVEIAEKELNILLGRDPATPVDVEKEITIPYFTGEYDELKKLALDRNSELRIARQNMKVAEQGVGLAQSNFYPLLRLNASYGYTDRTVDPANPATGDIETQSTDGSVALNLSFNLFNGFRDKIDLQNAEIELKNRELYLKDEKNRVTGLLHEKYVTLQQRLKTVELERENVRAAEQNLQLQEDRYKTGSATSLEFRDAQVNLSRAQTTLIAAKYQARISLLEIQQLVGNIEIR